MRKVTDKQKANLKPFKPNNPETGEKDERINRKGRAKSFDELRALFQDIANEEVTDKEGKITRIRQIGLKMSKAQLKDFLEFAYGKVPLSQIVDITSGGKPIGWKAFINGDDESTDTETGSK